MKKTCNCGNIFEFSEKSIGQKVVCQKCHLEVILEDSSQAIETPIVKFSLEKFLKYLGVYALFFGAVFVGLLFYDRQKHLDSILHQAKQSISVTGDSLARQAEKILNHANLQYPKCIGKWQIQKTSSQSEWLIFYRIYKRDGLLLHEARFQVILAEILVVSPLNELALEIQGDLEAQQAFLQESSSKIRLPKVNLRQTGDEISRIRENMNQKRKVLPGFQPKRE